MPADCDFQVLFDGNPEPIWVYDPETLRILAVNTASVDRYGYSREEFKGMRLTDIRSPEDAEWLRHELATVPGSTFSHRGQHVLSDGSVLHVQALGYPILFRGQPARMVLLRDITEKIRAEEARARSERILDSIGSLVLVVDSGGLVTYVGSAVEDVLGYSVEDMWGEGWWEAAYGDPEERERERSLIAAMASGGGPVPEIPVEQSIRRRGGEERWIIWQYTCEAAGEVICVGHDITTRKRAEAKLSTSHELLTSLMNAAPFGLLSIDHLGHLMLWNPAAEEIFGWKEEEVLGAPPPMVPDSERRMFRSSVQSVLSGRHIRRQAVYVRKDGTPVHVSISARPLLDEQGKVLGTLAALVDVGEGRKLEEQLRTAQKLDALGRLAGGVAHDFNNVLTGILGFADLALMEVEGEAPAAKDLISIQEAAFHARDLTSQLLTFASQQPGSLEVLDLNAVVTELKKLLGRTLGDHIELAHTLAPDLGFVRADPSQMNQVIVNLAVNGRDAMGEGGRLTIATRNLEVGPDSEGQHPELDPGSYVVLSVTDCGEGIPVTVRDRIFEPFFSTKGPDGGSGLGLSTVYGIVTGSEGHVRVESEVGVGTTFEIFFPRVESEAAGSVSPTWERQCPDCAGSETILVVEDEPMILGLVKRILEARGYTVIASTNPMEAAEIFERDPSGVDLVLSDVMMPVLSGPKLAERLRAIRKDVKVLFMSGYVSTVLSESPHSLGEDELLMKPFTATSLAQRVREAITVMPAARA